MTIVLVFQIMKNYGEKMLINLISGIIKVICCIIFLKCFKRKIINLTNFYYIVEEMKVARYIKNKKIVASILVTFDFSVPIYFLMIKKMNIYYLLILLFFQLFYLAEMLKRKDEENEKNCDCYVINLPRKISVGSVFFNALISYLFVIIFILDNLY